MDGWMDYMISILKYLLKQHKMADVLVLRSTWQCNSEQCL